MKKDILSGIIIRRMRKNEDARQFQRNVNALVAENALIHLDAPQTLAQEKKWLQELWQLVKKKEAKVWITEKDSKAAGISEARKGYGREKDNVEIRIGIVPSEQGKGMGTQLISRSIRDAKTWKARNIWLSVLAENKPAIALYRKKGFRTVATLPKWAQNKGGYMDKYIMVLPQ